MLPLPPLLSLPFPTSFSSGIFTPFPLFSVGGVYIDDGFNLSVVDLLYNYTITMLTQQQYAPYPLIPNFGFDFFGGVVTTGIQPYLDTFRRLRPNPRNYTVVVDNSTAGVYTYTCSTPGTAYYTDVVTYIWDKSSFTSQEIRHRGIDTKIPQYVENQYVGDHIHKSDDYDIYTVKMTPPPDFTGILVLFDIIYIGSKLHIGQLFMLYKCGRFDFFNTSEFRRYLNYYFACEEYGTRVWVKSRNRTQVRKTHRQYFTIPDFISNWVMLKTIIEDTTFIEDYIYGVGPEGTHINYPPTEINDLKIYENITALHPFRIC